MSIMRMYAVVSTLCQHRLHNPTKSAYLRVQRIDGWKGHSVPCHDMATRWRKITGQEKGGCCCDREDD